LLVLALLQHGLKEKIERHDPRIIKRAKEKNPTGRVSLTPPQRGQIIFSEVNNYLSHFTNSKKIAGISIYLGVFSLSTSFLDFF
jgi:hypothetical protein